MRIRTTTGRSASPLPGANNNHDERPCTAVTSVKIGGSR
jgi:hypothetical protein